MDTRYLDLPGGRLAYDYFGESSGGPLVVCAPGMGDLRGEYRFLAPRLAAAGWRVVVFDVRGHGESSVQWNDYSVAAIGADMLAIARALGDGPVYLAGNSMAGGAAVWAAAEAPQLVAGLVLIDPVVHDANGPQWLSNLLLSALFARPWGLPIWMRYFTSLYPTARPDDFPAYVDRLRANLREPGRFAALRHMVFASKAAATARLAEVKAPALIVMGTRDRDFKNPAQEADSVAGSLVGTVTTVQLIEGAGHYPHAEMPDRTGPVVVTFLGGLRERVTHGAGA